MILEYEFETALDSWDEREEYCDTEYYEYEIDNYDEKQVATRMVMFDMDCKKELVEEIVEKVLWTNDLLIDYLKTDIDYVKKFFEKKAEKEFWETKED